jgi:hypothetical protein
MQVGLYIWSANRSRFTTLWEILNVQKNPFRPTRMGK